MPSLKTLVYLQLLLIKRIMNPYKMRSVLQRQSSLKEEHKKTSQQKLQLTKSLLAILQADKSFNTIDFLFGYTLAASNIPLTDNTAIQLRKNFKTFREMHLDKLISTQDVAFIIIDSIQYKRMDQSRSKKQLNKRFLGIIQYNLGEIMINRKYIYDKWEKQQKIEQENQKNEMAFQQFMEEEKRKTRREAEEAEAQGWECPVCCSQIDRNFFGILQCGHIFHPECINAYLKTKIQANQVQIACPMEGCKHGLDAGQIYSYIDGQLRQKYEKFSFNQFVQKNNASTSWCPTAGCQAVFEFDQALDNYRCPACKKHYCLRCRCDYHVGMTCKQYRINNSFDKNDEAFIKFAQGAKFKQCPKCKYWVERNTGCPTMTCKCGQQFCYDCGGTGCPHGSCSNSGRGMAPLVMPSIRPPPAPFIRK